MQALILGGSTTKKKVL